MQKATTEQYSPHVAGLVVEREVTDINGAGALKYFVWIPCHSSIMYITTAITFLSDSSVFALQCVKHNFKNQSGQYCSRKVFLNTFCQVLL